MSWSGQIPGQFTPHNLPTHVDLPVTNISNHNDFLARKNEFVEKGKKELGKFYEITGEWTQKNGQSVVGFELKLNHVDLSVDNEFVKMCCDIKKLKIKIELV